MVNNLEKPVPKIPEVTPITSKIEKQILSPEQKEAESFTKKLDELSASLNFIGSYGKNLIDGTKKLGAPEDKEDEKELENIRKRIQQLKAEFMKLNSEKVLTLSKIQDLKKQISPISSSIDKLEFSAGINEKLEKLKYTTEDLKTISNKEFLSANEDERLQYITKDNVDSTSVASGNIKDITFNFTFDGKFNKDLYMLTTAGQVLPSEVRKVTKEGVEYERNGLKGEFYNGDKRLVIKDGTNINISRIGNKKELQKIDSGNQTKIKEFIDKNPEFQDEKKYGNTIKEAIDKGIIDDNQIKFLLTGKTEFLKDSKPEELEKLLTVSMYLKNAGFLDDAGIDAKDIVTDLKEIINILKGYGNGLKYDIVYGNIKFDLKDGLPEGIEGEGIGKFIKVALSQLGINEFDGGADKYLSKYGNGLNSRNTPWCVAFVNWSLEQSGYKGTGGLSAKEFIGESGYGHVGIKVGDKLLGGNQGNRVSLNTLNINKVEGYVMPNTGKIFKEGFDNIPDGAIVVYGRNAGDKRYS